MKLKSFTKIQNQQFWEEEALRKQDDPTGTHSDPYIVQLENNFVIKSLGKASGKNILDIGCGNGQRTIQFAKAAQVKKITGIDYSKNMINIANKILSKQPKSVRDRISFDVYDAQKFEGTKFDIITSCRCLINQPTMKAQMDLFNLVYRHLKKGGSFIIAEGSLQGFQKLNKTRKKVGLDPITIAGYNLPLDEKKIFPKLKKMFWNKNLSRLGTYFLLTRVFYPATIYPKNPNPKSINNKVAFEMQKQNDTDFFYGAHLLVHFIKI